MDYRKELNENQYKAVTSNAQYARVVAGAGSGKTRVLTYRLAYLVGEKNVDRRSIVAIAFTNKVAGEMKTRAINLLNNKGQGISVSTFHSFCARFLRQEIERVTSLGVTKLVLHPGSHVGLGLDTAISNIAKGLNMILGTHDVKILFPDVLYFSTQRHRNFIFCSGYCHILLLH